jgi:hypothetical protein
MELTHLVVWVYWGDSSRSGAVGEASVWTVDG